MIIPTRWRGVLRTAAICVVVLAAVVMLPGSLLRAEVPTVTTTEGFEVAPLPLPGDILPTVSASESSLISPESTPEYVPLVETVSPSAALFASPSVGAELATPIESASPSPVASVSVVAPDIAAALSEAVGAEAGSGYAVSVDSYDVSAENAAQNYDVVFSGSGLEFSPGFSLSVVGEDYMRPLIDRNVVTYQRNGYTEWYINGPLGLEQGFTLERQVPLEVTIEKGGALQLQPDGKGIDIKMGPRTFHYQGLTAVDARGADVPVTFVQKSPRVFTLSIDDVGAVYPITVDPFVQEGSLTPGDIVAGDGLGYGIAVDSTGTRAIVSAPGQQVGANADQGAVYIYKRTDTTWSLEQKITASDGAADDAFGYGVAMDSTGTRVAVGAFLDSVGANAYQGSAYIYTRTDTTWNLEQKVTASDGIAEDLFGVIVAFDADATRLVVTAPWNYYSGNQGVAYVYLRTDTTWSEEEKLVPPDGVSFDSFGRSAAFDASGTRVVFGANGKGNFTGAAYVFLRSDTTWTFEQKLTGSLTQSGDVFGNSVAINSAGDRIAVGASANIYGYEATGDVFVFSRSASVWSEDQKFQPLGFQGANSFGFSLALDSTGTKLIVGSPRVHDGTRPGALYYFTYDTSWTQAQQLLTDNSMNGDQLGWAVAMDSTGDRVFAGAPGLGSGTGDAYPFAYFPDQFLSLTFSGSGWVTSSPAGIDCGSDCTASFVSGAEVTLTADPASGYTFAGWSGDADCEDGVVTMSVAVACTATFTLIPPRVLTIQFAGTGAGEVYTYPYTYGGFWQSTDFTDSFSNGTTVWLYQQAANDFRSSFAGWSGDADCEDGTVTMNGDITCVANFDFEVVPFDGGDGSPGDPYQLSQCEQLQAIGFAENLDKHYLQTQDIDCSESESWHGWEGFYSIGSDVVPFTGTYDGGGYVITELTMQYFSDALVGLFGYTDGATIQNVGMESATIQPYGNPNAGTIVGLATNTLIRNVHADGALGNPPAGTFHISRLRDGHIEEVYTKGFSVQYETHAFELADIDDTLTLEVVQSGKLPFAGIDAMALSACGSHLPITSAVVKQNEQDVRDDITSIDSDVVVAHERPIDVTWDMPAGCARATLSLTANEYGHARPFRYPEQGTIAYTVGSRVASPAVDGDISDSTSGAPLFVPHWISGTGHPEGDVPVFVSNDKSNVYVSADVTIDNTDDFGADWIAIAVNGKLFRVSDVDASYGKCSFGRTERVAYKHATCELRIPRSEIANTNTLLLSLEYYGTAGQPAHWGGLVGSLEDDSLLEQSYSFTSIGYPYWTLSGYVGGLVGYQDPSSSILNTYARGEVWHNTGGGGPTSYERGPTFSGTNVGGGLVGVSYGAITDSYSTTAVNGVSYGLAAGTGSAVNSYWDTEVSGQSASEKGSGRTTAEMMLFENYVDWDFDDIWDIEEDINDGYPFFGDTPLPSSGGGGGSSGSFLSPEQLANLFGSPTPSATPSPTPIPSATPTPSVSAVPSASVTPRLSPTPSASVSPSASASPEPSQSETPLPLVSREPLITPPSQPGEEQGRGVSDAARGIASAIPSVAVSATALVSVFILSAIASVSGSLFGFFSSTTAAALSVIGLKRRRKVWGVVYDARTKAPIPYAKVELRDASNRVLETRYTNHTGQYGFLTSPASLQTQSLSCSLAPSAKGYTFPSTIVTSDPDFVVYDHVYHGGLISISGDLVSNNIPMDPVSATSSRLSQPLLSGLSVTLLDIAFWIGLIAAPINAYLHPSAFSIGLLIVFLGVNSIRALSDLYRPFGSVTDSSTNRPLSYALVTLSDSSGKRISYAVSDARGRYILSAPPGSYTLTAYTPAQTQPQRTRSLSLATKGWVRTSFRF